MTYFRALALFAFFTAIISIAACAESGPGEGTQDPSSETQEPTDTSDASDTEGEESDAADSSDDTDASDPSESEPIEETTGGLDCSGDETLCEAPFECITNNCRIPLSGLSETELEFTFAQPEELDEIFSLFKTFAAGLKFFAIDVADSTAIPGRYSAIYGSADIISEEPLIIDWQRPEEPEYVFFNPYIPQDGVDDGTGWESEGFTYKLRADADIQFGTFSTNADIALDILDSSIIHHQDVDGGNSVATLLGHLTRAEAENRDLGTHEELEGIMLNFVCKEITDYVPAPDSSGEVKWRLSDVLDCNMAEMDVDRDGDGVMETYQVELEVVLGSATFQ